MSEPETQLTLQEQLIEIMDNYHDGGEFHEYTPLEKKRHAAHITALFQQALTTLTELACDRCRVRIEDKLNNGGTQHE